MESLIEIEKGDSNDTTSLMEKLRNQLGGAQDGNDENLEESNTIRTEVNGNFLIVIDRVRRKERSQDKNNDFNPSSFITQCCAPLPLMARNRSTETPSTRSETLGGHSETGSIFTSESSSTSRGDYSDEKDVTVIANECNSIDTGEEEREERDTLRRKLDILTERTCHDESLRENVPSVYWTTDTEGDDDVFTLNGSIDRDTFTASNDDDALFNDTDTHPYSTRTDCEVEAEDGDDEIGEESGNRDELKATRVSENIYILRSEDSDMGDSTVNEPIQPRDESAEFCEDELPSLVSATLRSDSGLSSATFSENGDNFVEQMEEVRNYHFSLLKREERTENGDSISEQVEDRSKNEHATLSEEDKRDEINALPDKKAYELASAIVSMGDALKEAKEKKETSVPSDVHPEIANAIMSIGKALETATLNKFTIDISEESARKEIESTKAKEVDDSEPVLVASQSLDTLYSKIEDNFCKEVGLLYKIPYIHGSFAAAAPFLLNDLKWMRILRRLMPEAHAEAVVQLEKSHVEKDLRIAQIMKWAENNPVVAAYGLLANNFSKLAVSSPEQLRTPTVSNLEQSKPILPLRAPPLEWCIFLDPLIVAELENWIGKRDEAVAEEDKDKAADEVQKHVSRLVKRMVLSHGSSGQIVSEALGMSQAFTFGSLVDSFTQDGDVAGQSSTGIFTNTWMAIFAAALKLGGNMKTESNLVIPLNNEGYSSQLFCGLMLCLGLSDTNSTRTSHDNNSFGDSANIISTMLGAPLHVVLNIRTRQVPARVLGQLINFMGENSVHVDAIASFDIEELRPIVNFTSLPVKIYHLLYSAGDLQKACHAGEIGHGDYVFFNAASLIKTDQDTINVLLCGQDEYNGETVFADYAFSKKSELGYSKTCKATIEDYKNKFNLNIGCYLHEFAVTEENYTSLLEFFNNNSSIYNLGLSIGGINGRVATGTTGDGFARQCLMGATWNNDAKPLYSMEALSLLHSKPVQKVAGAGAWGPLGTINTGGKGWL